MAVLKSKVILEDRAFTHSPCGAPASNCVAFAVYYMKTVYELFRSHSYTALGAASHILAPNESSWEAKFTFLVIRSSGGHDQIGKQSFASSRPVSDLDLGA
jgi:hypothetical protein